MGDTLQEAKYHKSKDGRVLFESGWFELVQDFELKVGMTVLILFAMDGKYVKMSVDIL
jgi:hypothetical protein